jgi:carboxymethylenebutenolidase
VRSADQEVMVLVKESVADLDTPQGVMRTYIYEPKTTDVYQEKKYPGLIFFSAIFQRTPGVDRMAKWLAGHGYTLLNTSHI